MLIVDLGFSSAKWLYNDKQGIVKSCYRKIKGEEGYSYQGEQFLVGEKALLQTGSHYLRTVEELIEFYPLFAGVAAEKSGCKRQEDIIVVGLPYDFYKAEALKQKKGAQSVITTLQTSLKAIKVNGAEFSCKEVLVYPQGLGGVKDYLATTKEKAEGNILAIDIGFNTVISTLYSCEEGEILTGKTYYKKGIHDLATNLLLPTIGKHIGGKSLTPLEVNHLIQTKTIQVGFDLIDINPEIDAAANTYVTDLLHLVIGDLKAHGGVVNFQTVLLFGGGARLLQGKIQASKVKVIVLPEPEFANARGFRIKAEG